MSVDDLFVLAIIFHLVSIVLGGILLSKARGERGAAFGPAVVLIIGILIQGLPTGLILLLLSRGVTGVHWLLLGFGPLDAAAVLLWLLVGLVVYLLTMGRPKAT